MKNKIKNIAAMVFTLEGLVCLLSVTVVALIPVSIILNIIAVL